MYKTYFTVYILICINKEWIESNRDPYPIPYLLPYGINKEWIERKRIIKQAVIDLVRVSTKNELKVSIKSLKSISFCSGINKEWIERASWGLGSGVWPTIVSTKNELKGSKSCGRYNLYGFHLYQQRMNWKGTLTELVVVSDRKYQQRMNWKMSKVVPSDNTE